MVVLQTGVYAVALWLGCYLLARRPLARPIIFTGLGLVAYSGALATDVLLSAALPGARDAAWVAWVTRAHLVLLAAPAVCWAVALATLAQRGPVPPPRLRATMLVSALFFGLGGGLLLLRVPWLPRPALVLAIGADLLVFGWAIAALDAFDAGERLRLDFARSLAGAGLLLLVFGGQVTLAMAIQSPPPVPLVALLLGVVAAAIGIPTFWDPLQAALDRLVFGARSALSPRRAALLATASAAPRHPYDANPLALSEEELTALTRRALSSLGDLPRLAASPLTRLPLVERRLRERGASSEALDRAAELRAVLADSIRRLKPADAAEFGTTDAWRHYNSLYIPYVLGLRPYSRRSSGASDRHDTKEALLWFRAQVPERTLHNWQRAAAALVARDIRERSLAVSDRAPIPGPTPKNDAQLAVDGSVLPSRGSP